MSVWPMGNYDSQEAGLLLQLVEELVHHAPWWQNVGIPPLSGDGLGIQHNRLIIPIGRHEG